MFSRVLFPSVNNSYSNHRRRHGNEATINRFASSTKIPMNTGDVSSGPDWALIDEISIPLLETGVGTLPVLQAALPSILVIDLNDQKVDERFRKIIRIAQLQIQHLLRSQQELLKHLEKLEKKKMTDQKMLISNDSIKFKCDDCGKLFLNEKFLSSHFERRHPKTKNS